MTGAVLDVRDGRSTVYFGNEEARARRYADRAADTATSIDGVVAEVGEAKDAALGEIETEEENSLTAIVGARSGALTDINTAKTNAQAAIASDGSAQVTAATTQATRSTLSTYLNGKPFADGTAANAYTNALLQTGDTTTTQDGGIWRYDAATTPKWTRTRNSDARDAADSAAVLAGDVTRIEAVLATPPIYGANYMIPLAPSKLPVPAAGRTAMVSVNGAIAPVYATTRGWFYFADNAAVSGATGPTIPTYASINCFGDSMTWGAGATVPANNYVNVLGGLVGATIKINSGISGTVLQNGNFASGSPQVGNGRDRYVTALLGPNLTEALFLAYSYNDMRYVGAPATVNVDLFASDYAEVIAGSIVGGYFRSKITINTPFWVKDAILTGATEPGFAPVTRAQVLAYAEAVRTLAMEWGIRFADVYLATEGRNDLISADEVHPNDPGHAVYAQTLAQAQLLNPRALISATATISGSNLTFTAVQPLGEIPVSYTVRRVNNGTFDAVATTTSTSKTQTITGVPEGSYRLLYRANYADGTFTPWAISGILVVGLGAVFAQDSGFAGVANGTLLTAVPAPEIGTWSTRYSTSELQISGERIIGSSGGTPGVARLASSASLTNRTLVIEAVVDVKTNAAGLTVAVVGRMHDTNTRYLWGWYANGVYGIATAQSGNLASATPGNLSAGEHTFRLELTTTTQKLFVDNVLMVQSAAVDGVDVTGLGSGVGVRMNGAITGAAGPTIKSFRAALQ